MLRVCSKRYWDHEKHVLLECTSYEKNHSGEILVKNSNWRTHLFLMHVPCKIVKRLKHRVLSKKWTENKAKVVWISVFLRFQTKMWRILTSAEQRWIRGKQPWTALKQLCFRKKTALKQHWTAMIISKSVRSKVSWRKLLRKVQVLSKRNKI